MEAELISYEQVMEVTAGVSAPAAFEEPCCRLMYDTVASLQPGSTIVEVGVEYGRSTSILAQVAKDQEHRLILVDPFVDPASGIAAMKLLTRIGCPFELHKMATRQLIEFAGPRWALSIDLLHIDGDHTTEGITLDCRAFLPCVKLGGYACFHDFGHDSLPDVYPTVSHYMASGGWESVGLGHTLGVWRRK